MVTAASMTPHPQAPASGARLFSRDGRSLPLRASDLAVEAKGGIARTILTQRFVNPYDEPLTVTYLLPLPADGAVSGFAFELADQRIVGEIDKKARARQRFEEAVAAGHSAALLEQDRSSVFTQKVGNIPPKSEVVCEVVVDQRLAWIATEGQWEWRFPTVIGPRYMGEPGRVQDAAKITVDVADGPLPTTLAMTMEIGDAVIYDRTPESPSHPIENESAGLGRVVRLHPESGRSLDRDFIVRWPVAKPEVGVALAAGRPVGEAHEGRAYGLLTVVPPELAKQPTSVPRDLIFLIDTSGSMGGRPLDQAKSVLSAMVETLAPHDRLEMIEFSNRPNRWKKEPIVASREGKRAALKWLKKLSAGGGTEMKTGLLEAITPLRDGAQRQVVLVTDGYIGFENEIVETVLKKLPTSCRLHTVGVGSAPNRSLLTPVARAGGGVELVLAVDEDVERGAKRIIAKTEAPLVTELKISGDAVERVVPGTLPDLYAGSPALICVELSSLGGSIVVEGHTSEGTIEQRVSAPPLALGEGPQAIAALFAREWVEDLETLRCGGGDRRDVDETIEKVGLDFQISTRLTSWIAVSEARTVKNPGEARAEKMPHELPYAASAEGFGLRAPAGEMVGSLNKTMAGVVGGRGMRRRMKARPKKKKEAPPELFERKLEAEESEDFDEEVTGESLRALSVDFGASQGEGAAGGGAGDMADTDDLDLLEEDASVHRMQAPPMQSRPAPRAPSSAAAPSQASGPGAPPREEEARRDVAEPASELAPEPAPEPTRASAPAKEAQSSIAPAAHGKVSRPRKVPPLVAVLIGLGLVALAIILWLLFGGALS